MFLIHFLSIIFVFSYLGCLIAYYMPWRSGKHSKLLFIPTGLILSPFLFGIFVILSLILYNGLGSLIPYLKFLLPLSFVGIIFLFRKIKKNKFIFNRKLFIYLIIFIFLLVSNLMFLSVRLPLTENDALEYALVGRELFNANSLSIYPLINTDFVKSGFFAPWTHPPLYPALVYAAYVMQGDVASIDLIKIISPWFALTTLIGVIGLGSVINKFTGLVAGILYITIPLLVIGVETAAIDALPVAGMVLLMLGFVGLKQNNYLTYIVLGILLGLSLWTHSQSILFIPIFLILIFFINGWQNWKKNLVGSVFFIFFAFLVSFYPYYNNFSIYGSIISDNPAVFALESLDWSGYFKYTRSIYNYPTLFQYGVAKGIFSIHNYGFVFWISILGFLSLFLGGLLNKWFQDRRRMLSMNGKHSVLLASCIIIFIYYSGLVVSVLIGTELMIKNDRYLLVIIPPICIIAAYAFNFNLNKRLNNFTKRCLLILLTIFSLGHFVSYILYGNISPWLQLLDIRKNENKELNIKFSENPLSRWSGINLIKNLNSANHGGKVLALRPADMYYSKMKMVSYLDPIMVPMYGLDDPYELHNKLLNVGIEYIQLPAYFIPPVYNSTLMDLIADPNLASLIEDQQLSQIYKLNDTNYVKNENHIVEKKDLKNELWIEYPRIGVGGPAFSLKNYFFNFKNIPFSSESKAKIFAKSYSHMAEVGEYYSKDNSSLTEDRPIDVKPLKEYLVSMDVRGEGFMRVFIWMGDDVNVNWSGPYLAGDFVLSPDKNNLIFKKRMVVPIGVNKIKLGIERYGISKLTINDASIGLIDN